MSKFVWISFCFVLAWPVWGNTHEPDTKDVALSSGENRVSPMRNPFVDRPAAQFQDHGVSSRSLPAGVPRLNLRGYIENEDGSPMALLDVEGYTLYVVRTGDTISLRSGQQMIQLIVERIFNSKMQVRIGKTGPTMEVQ